MFVAGIGDIFGLLYEEINIGLHLIADWVGLLYEAINFGLHLIGDLIANIINWVSSIHLTDNSDRIVIPNPFYDP